MLIFTTFSGHGRSSPDPDFDDARTIEKQPIPDEKLWPMFGTGVSFRALSTILEQAFATVDVEDRFFTSHSYLFKNYQRMLASTEITYKAKIQQDESYGTVCFDHQATRKLSRKYEGNTHRLAVVWHSKASHNVIGMVEMTDKTAESQAQALKNICEQFGIMNDQIAGMACDNENTNVGIRGGTCILFERLINRSVLRVMCRHHIYELMIKSVYHCLFTTETPNNVFYNLLKQKWSSLRDADFPIRKFTEYSFIGDASLNSHRLFEEMKNTALTELRAHSRNKFIRDDYREVTRLALMFFGEELNITKRNQVKFRTIINPSNARFMATIIQGIECYLFRRSLDWNTAELQQMKYNIMRFSAFASLIYIRYWNRSSVLFDAPVNDLKLLQDLQRYKSFDTPVAKAAIHAVERHLHYMGEELAPLSLFSGKTTVYEKNMIASKLQETADIPTHARRDVGNDIAYTKSIGDDEYDWSSISLIDLIDDRSHFFFDVMNLPRNFLRLNANEWKRDEGYNKAMEIVQSTLICINDGSERVISNCKNKFSKQRCKKETSFRQNMLNLHINSELLQNISDNL